MANSTLLPLPLPPNISSHYITHLSSDLRYHYLSAGSPTAPRILLLHGFPETSFSWRHVLPQLASAGFHAVAPDMRGFGCTTGWDTRPFYATDLASFSMTTMLRDTIVFAYALGHESVHCLVGHDAGARVAALCALSRPDFYLRVVLLSHPYGGSPKLVLGPRRPGTPLEAVNIGVKPKPDIHAALAQLPEPRKHYKYYYASEDAAADLDPVEGMKEFLRGYFHLKSGSWAGNTPHPLESWTAPQLAQMPYYYVMPLHSGMRESVRLALEKNGGRSDVKKSESCI